MLFTNSVTLLPLESNFALTTLASTVSKLFFSFIANDIMLSAMAFTSLALASVVSIFPCNIKSVVNVLNIAFLISVVLPNFLFVANSFHLPLFIFFGKI